LKKILQKKSLNHAKTTTSTALPGLRMENVPRVLTT